MYAIFSPDDLRAGAVKGLTCLLPACTLSTFGTGSLHFFLNINNLSEDIAQLFFLFIFPNSVSTSTFFSPHFPQLNS